MPHLSRLAPAVGGPSPPQRTLFEALRIDYNLAFAGSICRDDERVRSRGILVETLGLVLSCLCTFCRDNRANQALAARQLDVLRRLAGPLRLPALPHGFDPALAAALDASSVARLGAEQVRMISW